MPRFSIKLLHPRYWLTWLGFGLWWLIIQMPYRWQLACSRGLGGLAMKLAKSRRKVAERNIELCFPELDEQQRAQMVRTNINSTMMAFFETGLAWFGAHRRLRTLFTMEGLEHLEQAKAEGQGAVLLAMHFTHLDLGAAFVSMTHSIDGLYRPHNNPVYDLMQRRGRQRHSDDGIAIPRQDMRQMVRRLRQGRVVWYAPDQDYGAKRPHLFAPFFGVPAATITGTSQLARMGRARVIPFTHFRREDGTGYDVKIFPPLENFPEGDEQIDVERINRFIEARVRECPEQYMWVHRRFKTRPEGEQSLYRKK